MLLSATLSNVCVSVRPSVCQPVCMPTCKFLCPTICSYVHPFICIRECLFQRVNVNACGEDKTICLSFYLIVNPPIRTNVTTVLCMFLSVCQPDRILSVYVSVRLLSVSPPVCVFKQQIVLVLVCYSIGLYDFFSSVRPFDRPSVHPSCRRSVSLNVNFFKSDACMHVRDNPYF